MCRLWFTCLPVLPWHARVATHLHGHCGGCHGMLRLRRIWMTTGVTVMACVQIATDLDDYKSALEDILAVKASGIPTDTDLDQLSRSVARIHLKVSADWNRCVCELLHDSGRYRTCPSQNVCWMWVDKSLREFSSIAQQRSKSLILLKHLSTVIYRYKHPVGLQNVQRHMTECSEAHVECSEYLM